MLTPEWCAMMAAYNAEMNRRIYAGASTLDDAQRRQDRGAFFGSIHATLNHLMWGDATWMARFAGWAPPSLGFGDHLSQFESWEALAAARADLDARILAWMREVDPAWLAGTLIWHNARMQSDFSRPVAVVVTHMFNHQTHHRGQVHAILTGFGVRTEDTDLPFILPFE